MEHRAFGPLFAFRPALAGNIHGSIISVCVGPRAREDAAKQQGKALQPKKNKGRAAAAKEQQKRKPEANAAKACEKAGDPAGRVSARVLGCDFR